MDSRDTQVWHVIGAKSFKKLLVLLTHVQRSRPDGNHLGNRCVAEAKALECPHRFRGKAMLRCPVIGLCNVADQQRQQHKLQSHPPTAEETETGPAGCASRSATCDRASSRANRPDSTSAQTSRWPA